MAQSRGAELLLYFHVLAGDPTQDQDMSCVASKSMASESMHFDCLNPSLGYSSAEQTSMLDMLAARLLIKRLFSA